MGLDPRCGQMFGPKMGPLLVGCSLGICIFGTAGIAEGYQGAGMNPARCFAFAVARRDFQRKNYDHLRLASGLFCSHPLLQTNGYGGVGPSQERWRKRLCTTLRLHTTERRLLRELLREVTVLRGRYRSCLSCERSLIGLMPSNAEAVI